MAIMVALVCAGMLAGVGLLAVRSDSAALTGRQPLVAAALSVAGAALVAGAGALLYGARRR